MWSWLESHAQVIFGARDSINGGSPETSPLRDDELAYRAICHSGQANGRHRCISAGQS